MLLHQSANIGGTVNFFWFGIFFAEPDGNTFPAQFLFNIFFFFKAVPVATTKSAICALMFVLKKRARQRKPDCYALFQHEQPPNML